VKRRRQTITIDVTTRNRLVQQMKNSIVARITLQCGPDAVSTSLRNQLENIANKVADDMAMSFRFTTRK
jgi:hypothetical protein